MQININQLTTESRNPDSMDIDRMDLDQQLALMNREDQNVALAIQRELPSIKPVIEKASACFQQGGRIIYCGAGTSGRLGLLDAVESMPTFSVANDQIIALLAGGARAESVAGEKMEDNYDAGVADLQPLNLNQNDIVIGIAASGRTPYVIGALDYARRCGAATVAIACNKNSLIAQHSDLAIEVDCGAEVLTGSTRLKAGSAQKMILNMISTITMIRCGKSYQNLMVDVEATNDKLEERWKQIVIQATGCSYQQAQQLYHDSDAKAKIAIVMYKLNCDKQQATARLAAANGFVRAAIELDNPIRNNSGA